jgi:RimJ/RimL family protein N-acetyltransferase
MIQPANQRSIRVAERLGFTPLRRDVLDGDPVIVYALEHSGAETE